MRLSRDVPLLPDDHGYECIFAEDFIKNASAAVLLRIIEMHPDAAIWREQASNLPQPIAQHRKSPVTAERVVVVAEVATSVEWRVDGAERDLLRDALVVRLRAAECGKGVESVAGDQQVATGTTLLPEAATFGQSARVVFSYEGYCPILRAP